MLSNDVLLRLFYPALGIVTVLYLTLSVITEVKQLQSLSGFVFFTLLMYLTSRHPNKVNNKERMRGRGGEGEAWSLPFELRNLLKLFQLLIAFAAEALVVGHL